MSDKLNVTIDDEVAILAMDDGKANAAGFDMLGAINDGLDRAQAEAGAVVLTGRPGVLSGGFDLNVIRGGDEAELNHLVDLGMRTVMRLYNHPQPLVVAATGHAVALGAFMLLAGDHRIGTMGDFRIGLNETALGLTLPRFGIELAEARLSRRHLTQAAIMAELYAPNDAVDAGFLDEIAATDDVLERAVARARTLAGYDGATYAANKASFRAALVQRVLAPTAS